MRRFLNTKVSIISLTLVVAVIAAAGVAWAAGLGAPSSQLGEEAIPTLIVTPMEVAEGQPALRVTGSGFQPNELLFVQIRRPGADTIVLPSVRANEARSFDLLVSTLPLSIEPGTYTVRVLGTRGSPTVTHPLVVTAAK